MPRWTCRRFRARRFAVRTVNAAWRDADLQAVHRDGFQSQRRAHEAPQASTRRERLDPNQRRHVGAAVVPNGEPSPAELRAWERGDLQ